MRATVVMVILVGLAILLTASAVHCDRTTSNPTAGGLVTAGPMGLTVFPAFPTSAGMVEIRVHGGDKQPVKALRVDGTTQFFVEVTEVPTKATYTLGVLPPGEYTFSLFQQINDTPICTHKLIDQTNFTVKSGGETGSGRLLLLLEGPDQSKAEVLLRKEQPHVNWLLGNMAVLRIIPGLEGSYKELLVNDPKIKRIELNQVGSIPECPPPLSPAVVPGALVISFSDRVTHSEAEEALSHLPPRVVDCHSVDNISPGEGEKAELSVVLMDVPRNWEAFFLNRYLHFPGVATGLIVGKKQ